MGRASVVAGSGQPGVPHLSQGVWGEAVGSWRLEDWVGPTGHLSWRDVAGPGLVDPWRGCGVSPPSPQGGGPAAAAHLLAWAHGLGQPRQLALGWPGRQAAICVSQARSRGARAPDPASAGVSRVLRLA